MKHFKLLSYLFVAVLCLGFVSCSNDDDDYDPTDLVGTWQWVRTEGWEIDEETGKKEPFDYDYTDDDDLDFYVYEADGTGYCYDEEINPYYTFKWTISGDKITITDNYDSEAIYIKELSSNKLVTVYSDSEYYEKNTFKRIK